MKSTRSERAQRRAAKQRNQRILLIALFILILAGAGFVYFSGAQNKNDNQLGIEEITPGSGPEAKAGDQVTVHYTGWLEDGTEFDSSVGREPFTFTLGQGDVIQGWDQGVAGMQVGSKRRLTIPPHLGYGAQANGPIPANSTLFFEVELLAIQ